MQHILSAILSDVAANEHPSEEYEICCLNFPYKRLFFFCINIAGKDNSKAIKLK